MDTTFQQVTVEPIREVVLTGDLLLLGAGALFSLMLWRKRPLVAQEFSRSWQLIFIASLFANGGFVLNLFLHLMWAGQWHLMVSPMVISIFKYGAYLVSILLLFLGIKQWYPLVLKVRQEAWAQAALYRKLVREANSIFLRWDRQGRVISINPYGEHLFGYKDEELKGRPVVGTLVPETDSQGQDLQSLIEAICRDPYAYRHNENENISRDGRRYWIAWRNTLIEKGRNGEAELLSVGVDITERKRMEEALQVLAATADPMPGADQVLDRTIEHLAQAYGVRYAFYGTFADESRREMILQALWDGEGIRRGCRYPIAGTPSEAVLAGTLDLVERGVAERFPEDPILAEWGIEGYFGQPLRDAQNEVIGVIAIMDTRPLELPRWNRSLLRVFASRIGGELQRRRAEADIHRLAHFDQLTGLPNRRLFQDRLEQAVVHARRNGQYLALLFIDLDRFKHINDTLGHASGDLLLAEVAQRIQARLRRSDTVARLGGDEFTVLLTDFADESALIHTVTKLSKQLIADLERPFVIQGTNMFISASIGVTCFPTDGEDARQLVRNADLAMYQAKERGRNRIEFYRPEFKEAVEHRSRLEQELRQALEKDQLQLYYQPIVDVERGHMVGLEALVRWRHPRRGLVLPADFVGIAEENGLMPALGEWVIETLCGQIGQWNAQGLTLGWVSFNLSVKQLQRGDLVERLDDACARHGVEPGQLMLELTEGSFLREVENSLPQLRRLRSRGYALAMDDFGTGYSSFGQLWELPVDTLKIDRGFVSKLDRKQEMANIVTAMLGMGQGLGLEVIAEGVETARQLHFLRNQGCRYMQGHLFATPMDADSCGQYLDDVHAWQGVSS